MQPSIHIVSKLFIVFKLTNSMPIIHLFIDTNVLLNFYHFADDSLEELVQLIDMISETGICLHLLEKYSISDALCRRG